jgi:hypothetical protein
MHKHPQPSKTPVPWQFDRETLDSKLEKDNARVTREWEALGDISGFDLKAIALAERQGKRLNSILAAHGYICH